MNLRLLASMLTVLCSWVVWEKWIVHEVEHKKVIEAVFEGNSLSECRAAIPDLVKQRAAKFIQTYKQEPEYYVLSNEISVILSRRGKKGEKDGGAVQQYIYYCLPFAVDPYNDSR